MLTRLRAICVSRKGMLIALAPVAILAFASCGDPVTDPPAMAPSFSTAADQSWQRSSFTVDGDVYIDCMGEDMHFFGEVPFIYHEVTSASGTFTYFYQLRPSTPTISPFLAQGETSGKLFTYKNGGPINETFQLSAGEVHTIVDREVYVADDGDRLEVELILHITTNANGDLTADHYDFSDFECVAH
jgi:hypothetical protein